MPIALVRPEEVSPVPADPGFRWTQDDFGDDRPGAGLTRPLAVARGVLARHGWLVRGVILVLALVLFELTANAAVATAAGCLELGRTDFATAVWLWRVDPDRARGRLGALGYVIQALSRITTSVFLILILLMGVLNGLAARGRPMQLPPHTLGAVLIWSLTSVAAAALSLLACGLALMTRRKVWLGPEPSLARRRGIWPPSQVTQPRMTEVRGDVFLQPLLAVWGQASVVLVVRSAPPGGQVPMTIVGLVLGMAIGIMVLSLVVARCVLARSAADCWPPGEDAVNSPGGIR